MATTQVSTWDQFAAAYTSAEGTSADPHIIEIMADLDAASSITATLNPGNDYHKIINGNYHNISNIGTSVTLNAVIFAGRHMTWNKCNFINIFRNQPYAVFYSSSSATMTFNDCTFQGQGAAICGESNMSANYTGRGYFNRCAITWTQTGSTYAGACFGAAQFDYSYIDCKFYRSNAGNYDIGRLTSSYIKGELIGSGITDSSMAMIGTISDSVINLKSTINFPRGIANTPNTPISVYNSEKMTGTIADTSNVSAVTDAQLKNAAYLASIGFNIAV